LRFCLAILRRASPASCLLSPEALGRDNGSARRFGQRAWAWAQVLHPERPRAKLQRSAVSLRRRRRRLLLPLRYLHSWPGSIATPVGPRLPETQKHGQCSSRLGDETFGHAYFSGDAVMAGAETADCGCFVGEPLS